MKNMQVTSCFKKPTPRTFWRERSRRITESFRSITFKITIQPLFQEKRFIRSKKNLPEEEAKKPSSVKKTKTNRGRYTSKYALSERLVCGDCGCYFRRVTWSIHGRKQIVWRCINRLEFGPKACKNSPSLKETALQASILDAIRSLIYGPAGRNGSGATGHTDTLYCRRG